MHKDEKNSGLISVIMPTYNHAKFIGEAIESVLNQTHKNFELIIIDNYSKDNTEKIVASIKDNRIKYLKFNNNGIIAASRNLGINNSNGQYIAFLDSDDKWIPEKLTKQVEYIQKHPNVALIYGLAKYFGNPLYKGRLLKQAKSISSHPSFEELFISNSISCLTVMVRESCLKEVGYFSEDPYFVSVEDWDLWLRIAHDYKIGFIPEVLSFYRVQPRSISKENKHYLKALKVVEQYENINWVCPELANKARYLIYFSAGMTDLHQQNSRMRSLFIKVFKESPIYFLRLKAFFGICISFLPAMLQKKLIKFYYRVRLA